MSDWLAQSFEEHSVFWLLLSGVIGGLISALLKFLFEVFFKAKFEESRARKKLVQQYSTPLYRTGKSLSNRVYNLIRNYPQATYSSDEYYRISTLYFLGEYLAWIRLLERQVNYLSFNNSKTSKQFDEQLHGIFAALTSWGYLKNDSSVKPKQIEASLIPRMVATAIGEVMIIKHEDGDTVMDFTGFIDAYYKEPDKFRWFQYVDNFLRDIPVNELVFTRLIILYLHLQQFLSLLSDEKEFIPNEKMKNALRLIPSKEIRDRVVSSSRKKWK